MNSPARPTPDEQDHGTTSRPANVLGGSPRPLKRSDPDAPERLAPGVEVGVVPPFGQVERRGADQPVRRIAITIRPTWWRFQAVSTRNKASCHDAVSPKPEPGSLKGGPRRWSGYVDFNGPWAGLVSETRHQDTALELDDKCGPKDGIQFVLPRVRRTKNDLRATR